jgi:hypothetical protein
MPLKCEGWSRYQNSTGADSQKSALETEDHVLKAENIDPIKSCLIRDDQHMRMHRRSKGRILTSALKVILRTRADRLLQWHAENGHVRKFSTSRSSITTRTTRFMLRSPLRCVLRVQEANTLPTSWFGRGGGATGCGTSSFLRERCENWCPSVSRGCATRSCETS